MKPMSEQHFAILRRHMVELIEMHMDLMGDEPAKAPSTSGLPLP